MKNYGVAAKDATHQIKGPSAAPELPDGLTLTGPVVSAVWISLLQVMFLLSPSRRAFRTLVALVAGLELRVSQIVRRYELD